MDNKKVYILMNSFECDDITESEILGVFNDIEKAKERLLEELETLKDSGVEYDNVEWRSDEHLCWDGYNDDNRYYTCLRIMKKEVE